MSEGKVTVGFDAIAVAKTAHVMAELWNAVRVRYEPRRLALSSDSAVLLNVCASDRING